MESMSFANGNAAALVTSQGACLCCRVGTLGNAFARGASQCESPWPQNLDALGQPPGVTAAREPDEVVITSRSHRIIGSLRHAIATQCEAQQHRKCKTLQGLNRTIPSVPAGISTLLVTPASDEPRSQLRVRKTN